MRDTREERPAEQPSPRASARAAVSASVEARDLSRCPDDHPPSLGPLAQPSAAATLDGRAPARGHASATDRSWLFSGVFFSVPAAILSPGRPFARPTQTKTCEPSVRRAPARRGASTGASCHALRPRLRAMSGGTSLPGDVACLGAALALSTEALRSRMFLLGGVFGKLIPFLMHGTNALYYGSVIYKWPSDGVVAPCGPVPRLALRCWRSAVSAGRRVATAL